MNLEIKASVLHNMMQNNNIPQRVKDNIDGGQFIKDILRALKQSCKPQIDYITVRKDKFTSPSFKNASYGIAYNFFSWQNFDSNNSPA